MPVAPKAYLAVPARTSMESGADEADVVAAAESVLDRLEDHADVAHATVCGVARDHTDLVVTHRGRRSATDLADAGVWWRLLADGAADYRFTTTVADDHLDDLAERSVRAAVRLNQPDPLQYDAGSLHRATHQGWTRGDPRELDADAKAERVEEALATATADLSLDRARVEYRDESLTETMLTTTGTTLRTSLARASAETTLAPVAGPTLRDHVGTTEGLSLLDDLPARLAALADTAADAAAAETTTWPDERRTTVALAPRAAARLFHHVSHYFEADLAALGACPIEPGDRVGPEELRVEDGVRAGSWAARAFDAEGRPTQPTTLIADGVATGRLHTVASAADAGAAADGSVVPSVGYESPPRPHARHLDVAPGSATVEDLREGASLWVERFERGSFGHVATREKRSSAMPPSVAYARHVASRTPEEFEAEAENQAVELPVALGYEFDDGATGPRVTDAVVEFAPRDLREALLGRRRSTVTGVCDKHGSRLPFAVRAPAVRLPVRVRNRV